MQILQGQAPLLHIRTPTLARIVFKQMFSHRFRSMLASEAIELDFYPYSYSREVPEWPSVFK
jgi:hypothetical protein